MRKYGRTAGEGVAGAEGAGGEGGAADVMGEVTQFEVMS